MNAKEIVVVGNSVGKETPMQISFSLGKNRHHVLTRTIRKKYMKTTNYAEIKPSVIVRAKKEMRTQEK